MTPHYPVDVASLVPSSRDFLQAVRTARKGLALVPWLDAENAAREALRMAESDVAALALSEVGPAMAEAARATRLPTLSLELVSSHDGALGARAFGADAVVLDPKADDPAREAAAASARSTRMVALSVVRTRHEVDRELARGAKSLIIQAPDVEALGTLAEAAPRSLVIAWPSRPLEALEEDVRRLLGRVDAVVVGIEVYGATGFERLVSELHL
jgi:indole-3-glycerol phosphate synthase